MSHTTMLNKETYTLRPYQAQISRELNSLPSSLLLMGTGTGKTLTAIDMVKKNGTENLLVVCPQNAISQWKVNARQHLPDYEIVEFKKSWTSKKINEYLKTFIPDGKTFIAINYDMIHLVEEFHNLIDPTWTIVVDEMHRMRNFGTPRKPVKVTHYLLKLGRLTDYKIGLTATPTQGMFGGYINYFSLLKFLGYIDMSYKAFCDSYVMYESKSFGSSPFPVKQIVGYKNTHEIDELLKIISRRYVAEYGDFEPQHIEVKLDRCESYARVNREKAYLKDGKAIVLNNSSRSRIAKKTLATGTIYGRDFEGNPYAFKDNTVKIDWLKDFLSDTDEVVTVTYMYNVELESLKELCEKLGKKYIVINGETKNKYELVNAGGYDVVLGQFQAMSEALDGLHHHCHIEVFFSMPESSIHYIQMLGRIDRVGQTKVPMYYFLIMEKTLDEAIMKILKEKIEFSDALLDKLAIEEEM